MNILFTLVCVKSLNNDIILVLFTMSASHFNCLTVTCILTTNSLSNPYNYCISNEIKLPLR